MQKIIIKTPINTLSLGQTSYCLLREMYKRNADISVWPIEPRVDLDPFNPDPKFAQWLREMVVNRYFKYDVETPSLNMWHINGSESRITKSQNLFTFHETDRLTAHEVKLLAAQDRIFVSSNYTRDTFINAGIDDKKVIFAPLGFDESLLFGAKKPNPTIQFSLIGKLEKRKNTLKILKLWTKHFGNKSGYALTCIIHNPFIKPEQQQQMIMEALGPVRYTNIQFLPYLKSNKEVASIMNNMDIDLSGISNAEGWGLPSFNSVCLGKHAIVTNVTAHKDWATEDVAVMLEPSGKQNVYDNIHFIENQPFNQGQIYDFSDDDIVAAFDKVVARYRASSTNHEGIKLRTKFTWANTLDILEANMV